MTSLPLLPVALALLVIACAPAPRPLVIAPRTRLVVVAPHPDDETIAAGGLIQGVLAVGGSVTIVVVTDGDGYREAAAALEGVPAPEPADYRALGRRRRDEAIAAAARLGVGRDHVLLLGYPDGGLEALWNADWAASARYVSPYSRRGPFKGHVLYDRLRHVLAAARPTLVVVPDPRDLHADHAFAARFALAATSAVVPAPEVLTGVVHDAAWPPAVADAGRMPPPSDPAYDGTAWCSFDLPPGALAAKGAALAAYPTQLRVLGGLLERFLRPNEVFAIWSAPQS